MYPRLVGSWLMVELITLVLCFIKQLQLICDCIRVLLFMAIYFHWNPTYLKTWIYSDWYPSLCVWGSILHPPLDLSTQPPGAGRNFVACSVPGCLTWLRKITDATVTSNVVTLSIFTPCNLTKFAIYIPHKPESYRMMYM